MNLKDFYGWMRGLYLYRRLEEDTLEMVGKAKQIIRRPDSLEKKEGKPLNIWVGIVFIFISILAFCIVLPMIAGMFAIIFEGADPNVTPSLSIQALTGFIIVSAALGGFILWFGRYTSQNVEEREQITREIRFVGKLFLLAALSLSLFMLLSPILPTIKEATDFYNSFLKVIAWLSLIGGCISFVIADVIGLVYIVWRL